MNGSSGEQGLAPLGYQLVQLVAPEMRKGLHTKLTSEAVEVLCRAVLAGMKPTRAVIAAGFSRNCWSNWCAKADSNEQPYRSAVDAIQRAEAVFLASIEERVALGSINDPRIGLAILEKRLRPEYGQKIEVTANTQDVEDMSRDELLAIAHGKTPVPQV